MRSVLGGESLFSQTLTAASADGDVLVGSPSVGDVELITVAPDRPVLLAKTAFLAADMSVDITTATQRNIMGALTSGAQLRRRGSNPVQRHYWYLDSLENGLKETRCKNPPNRLRVRRVLQTS